MKSTSAGLSAAFWPALFKARTGVSPFAHVLAPRNDGHVTEVFPAANLSFFKTAEPGGVSHGYPR